MRQGWFRLFSMIIINVIFLSISSLISTLMLLFLYLSISLPLFLSSSLLSPSLPLSPSLSVSFPLSPLQQ